MFDPDTAAVPDRLRGQWQDVAVLRPPPESATLRRRDVLAGFCRGAAGLGLLAVTASACGSSEPEVDPLQAQSDQATADAEQARAAAATAAPPLARALTQVAAERAEHARALDVEIARAAGRPAPTGTTASATATPTAPAGPAPTVKDVVGALRRAADSAGRLAATRAGYRAGLLGSIAASCTASATVTLNAPAVAR